MAYNIYLKSMRNGSDKFIESCDDYMKAVEKVKKLYNTLDDDDIIKNMLYYSIEAK